MLIPWRYASSPPSVGWSVDVFSAEALLRMCRSLGKFGASPMTTRRGKAAREADRRIYQSTTHFSYHRDEYIYLHEWLIFMVHIGR